MTVALAGATAVSMNSERRRANSGRRGVNQTVDVPKTHLLNPFSVAPGSYVRRWIVLKKPQISNSNFGINLPVYTEVKLGGKHATFGTQL
jgi:hypothetical protein